MRMDEIGWHHRHDSAFRNIRTEGAGDWLMLLIKTPAVIRIAESEQHTPAGTLILYTPDFPQDYGADGGDYIDDWIHFEPDAEEKALLKELDIPLNQPVTLQSSTSPSSLIRQICMEFYSARLHRQEIANLYFRILLYELQGQITTALSDEAFQRQIKWIQSCIFRKPFDKFRAEQFAKQLSVTTAEFEEAYAACCGYTFQQDTVRSILCYSLQRKAQEPDLTEEELAQLCGYADTEEYLTHLHEYYPKA